MTNGDHAGRMTRRVLRDLRKLFSRRRALQGMGATVGVGIVGCKNDDADANDDGTTGADDTDCGEAGRDARGSRHDREVDVRVERTRGRIGDADARSTVGIGARVHDVAAVDECVLELERSARR